MRKTNLFLLSVVVLITLGSCDRNELRLTQYDLPGDKAYVRFAFLSPNTPSVMIKVNNTKINGGTTPGYLGIFPAVFTAPDYAAVEPNGTVQLSLANTGTANDSVVLFSGAFTADAKKFYSVTLADTGIDRTVFSVEDKLGALPDSGFFNIRLLNAI